MLTAFTFGFTVGAFFVGIAAPIYAATIIYRKGKVWLKMD